MSCLSLQCKTETTHWAKRHSTHNGNICKGISHLHSFLSAAIKRQIARAVQRLDQHATAETLPHLQLTHRLQKSLVCPSTHKARAIYAGADKILEGISEQEPDNCITRGHRHGIYSDEQMFAYRGVTFAEHWLQQVLHSPIPYVHFLLLCPLASIIQSREIKGAVNWSRADSHISKAYLCDFVRVQILLHNTHLEGEKRNLGLHWSSQITAAWGNEAHLADFLKQLVRLNV